MTAKSNFLLAFAFMIGCGSGLASAAAETTFVPRQIPSGVDGCTSGPTRQSRCVKAPEIDATSGVQAIALLSGILLLVGERARRVRAAKDYSGSPALRSPV